MSGMCCSRWQAAAYAVELDEGIVERVPGDGVSDDLGLDLAELAEDDLQVLPGEAEAHGGGREAKVVSRVMHLRTN